MKHIKDTISWSTFEKIDIRVGTITKVEEFPEAHKPSYKLYVDLGPLGTKKSSAQITKHYHIDELPGKQVVCVVNFGAKQIGPFISEVLVTGFADDNGDVILATVDKKTPNGSVFF